jgi:hypothetical protein
LAEADEAIADAAIAAAAIQWIDIFYLLIEPGDDGRGNESCSAPSLLCAFLTGTTTNYPGCCPSANGYLDPDSIRETRSLRPSRRQGKLVAMMEEQGVVSHANRVGKREGLAPER